MLERLVLLMLLTLAALGCGRPAGKDRPAPLLVVEWQAMPADQKYTPEALERLKEGEPKLQTPEGWEEFSRTTLAAARRKDFSRRR